MNLQIETSGAVPADPLFEEAAAGVYIGGTDRPIPARTMQRWRYERTGPAYVKLRHMVRYRKPALDAYLASCERIPAA